MNTKTIAAVCLAVGLSCPVWAQDKAAQPQAEENLLKGTLEETLQPYVESGALSGAISILIDGEAEEISLIGYSDIRTKRRVTLDDMFMQCSQTKGFCGVTVAKLVEEGRLNLDDPVSKYLPEFKELWIETSNSNGVRTLTKAKNVLTVRMCLNHTGGFPFEISCKQHNIPGGGWSGGAPIRSAAAIAAASPLLFEPGTRVQYSNTGIDIGAAVVQTIVGKPWEVYLKEAVLDPLGMKSATFWPTDEQLKNHFELAMCHKDQPATYLLQANWEQRPYNDSHVFASAGAGLWLTARDQVKFYKMLMNLGVGENGARILKEETVKSILAVSTRPESMKDGYSLGLAAPLPANDSDNAWFGHGGAWGTNAMVNWHRKQLRLWVVQLQGGPRPWDRVKDQYCERYFKQRQANGNVDAYTGRTK